MSSFTRFEAFTRVSDRSQIYRLDLPLVWAIGARDSGWTLTVAKGTEFDISVPSWLEWALSPHDRRVLPAAAIHDALLTRGLDPVFAAAEFRRACIARGCAAWWAWMLFLAALVWTAAINPKDTEA